MPQRRTVAFFPEAAFGPALNAVGIAQQCRELGHRVVFLCDPGFASVFAGYGFEERPINLSESLPPEEMARYWSDFINSHIPNFGKSPYDQIDNYVRECWEAIVDTSIWAEKELPQALEELQPDVVCVDNVILFPAIKRFAAPWVRIISCSENEIPDPDIPPHLSGCGGHDRDCFERFRTRFNEVIAPVHARFNAFLETCGEEPYPMGEFFEPSPFLNLLLYPEAVRFKRRKPLDPRRFQYLEGCVRIEEAYEISSFDAAADRPLVYVSFGSLGCGDTALLQRLIGLLGRLPYRALVNVGDYLEDYDPPPPNVRLAAWYPQPSIVEQADVVIHHGGNNSFTECLYFGKPALTLPYVWDGHDNATRAQETGHGLKLHRYDWQDDELAGVLERLLTDARIRQRLQRTSADMRAQDGPRRAAELIDGVLADAR